MKKMKLNIDTLYTLPHTKHTDIPIIIHINTYKLQTHIRIYTYIYTYNRVLFRDFFGGGSKFQALARGKVLVGHTQLSLKNTHVTSAILDGDHEWHHSMCQCVYYCGLLTYHLCMTTVLCKPLFGSSQYYEVYTGSY